MNVREAELRDVKGLVAFAGAELRRLGFRADVLPQPLLQNWRRDSRSLVALIEDTGTPVSLLVVRIADSATFGRMAVLRFWLIDPSRPDFTLLMDTMALWLCNHLQSQGIQRVTGECVIPWLIAHLSTVLGAQTSQSNLGTVLWAQTDEVMRTILERRPEWRL